MHNPVNILFLCTGNSCRSQIAEGWARHLGGGRVKAQSAGLEAHGQNPRALAVMSQVGIDISDQHSSVVSNEMVQAADIVVTVCGHADEHCPAVASEARKLHWPLADPAKATGTEEQIMRAFTATRDEIEDRVRKLLVEVART